MNHTRKLIVTEFMTLDGVVEAPGGNETTHPHAGWQSDYRSPAASQYKADELATIDALLLGRKTYDQFAGYWPSQKGGHFAERINQLPKYVVSRTRSTVDWNNSHLLHDVPEAVSKLKQSAGGPILVYGSATLVQSLLGYDLVDELRLMIYPLSIGGGLRLFEDSRRLQQFKLKHSRALEHGILLLEYEPLR